jgi:pyruvate formate lyase activating enzyme
MLDWPGKVAVTIFLSGCDFHCPFCHNPGLARGTTLSADWSDLTTYLDTRSEWIDGVVITGGEPTTDPDLMVLLGELRRLGVSIKLDTNGAHPALLMEAVDRGLVDHVAVDIKTTPERYHLLTAVPDAARRVTETVGLLVGAGISHEFRTTAYRPLITPAELPRIAESLSGGHLYAIQQFRPTVTLDPAAADVVPASPLALLTAAEACRQWIPTVTRGV